MVYMNMRQVRRDHRKLASSIGKSLRQWMRERHTLWPMAIHVNNQKALRIVGE